MRLNFFVVVVIPALLVLFGIASISARLFQPMSVALRIGVLFAIGFAAGAYLSVMVFAVFTNGDPLFSTLQFIGFLSALGGGGLIGGALVLWVSIKLHILTLRSKGVSVGKPASAPLAPHSPDRRFRSVFLAASAPLLRGCHRTSSRAHSRIKGL